MTTVSAWCKRRSRIAVGDAGVVVEDRRPLLERLVSGEDHRATLVALADYLEEQIGAGLVEREIPDLVQDQGRRRQIPIEFRP